MKYWKGYHVLFAMTNGMIPLLNNMQVSEHDGDEGRLDAVIFFMCKCVKNYGLLGYFGRFLDQFTDVEAMCQYVDICDLKLKYGFSTFDAKCGYPLCTKRKGQRGFAAKSICKGCRLVRYCSRSHQKRHWKYMHRA